jgi:hypothetical protein
MRHTHVLRPSAVSYQASTIVGALMPVIPQTYILLRCECGQGAGSLGAMTLPGRWTLAQVRGEPEPSPDEPDTVPATTPAAITA